MFVIKRDGNEEPIQFDKITRRIANMRDLEPKLSVDPAIVAQKTIAGAYPGVKTSELDTLAAEDSAGMITVHPDYSLLASRIAVSNLQKETANKFSDCIEILYRYVNPKNNKWSPLISDSVYALVMKYKDYLDDLIVDSRDFLFDYFGFKTLEKSYLLKVNDKIVERPQYLFMRVAVGIHDTLKDIKETYDLISQKYFTLATPTLFNAGTPRAQMSSCFLLTMKEDSISGIYETLKDCALISKHAGGIGLAVHDIRSTSSYIAGTNGISNGIIPMLRVFNDTARYVDQCFTPDTLIYTDKGIKCIADVTFTDKVLSSDGELHKVIKPVLHNYKGEMLQIENNLGVTRVTPDHQIFVLKSRGHDIDILRSRLDISLSEPEFIDTRDLKIGDFTVFRRNACKNYNEYFNTFVHGNYLYSRVKSIKTIQYEGVVHDFEIESPHDYTVAHLGIAHNGGGKRKGSFAIYIEPHHPDIFEFLELKKNTGKEELRARDLFYALWVSDLFMRRVEEDSHFSLMCPNECPGLSDVHSEEFEKLYLKYESEGKYKRQIRARELWEKIIESQIESGTPYMLYKDHCNRKSNQQNLGTIRSSNLCSEIVEYTSPDEIAVCNLASISLPKFVSNGKFDHEKLFEVVQVITRNLDRVIDKNYYPVKEAENSNKRHRPIGIGIQGLADVFILLDMPYDSNEARLLNVEIFDTIYYSAVWASIDLAKELGTYPSYAGSPASQGRLQYDLWNEKPLSRWDYQLLKERLSKYGLRNSLLTCIQPTASTAQIMGNNESYEPYTSNIYVRRTLSGEFKMVNTHLFNLLNSLKLWSPKLKDKIVAANGSIQSIPEIPDKIKAIFKTTWEIKQRCIIDMSADRGKYICQSQSLNLHFENPTYTQLNSAHLYGWKRGLKTGMYYLRTRPSSDPTKITVEETTVESKNEDAMVCTREAGCISCQ